MQGSTAMQVRRADATMNLLREAHKANHLRARSLRSVRSSAPPTALPAFEPQARLTRVAATACLNANLENMAPRRSSVCGAEHVQRLPLATARAGAPPAMPSARARSPVLGVRSALQDVTNVANTRVPQLAGKAARRPSVVSQAPPAAANSILVPAVRPVVEEVVAAKKRGAKVEQEPAEVQEAVPENLRDVAEYLPDILGAFFQEEASYLPRADYMVEQPELNPQMRAILVDWLVEVHLKYQLRSETLFLTINIIDRYLSLVAVPRRKLQLIGVVAMFIAAKFEEVDPPRVADFCYITDNSYSASEIIRTESRVLAALNFRIMAPTSAHFMERLSAANNCDAKHRSLAQYLLELSLGETSMLRHAPSRLVASSLLLSNELVGRGLAWPAPMARASRQEEAVLKPAVEELRALFLAAPRSRLQATRRKFLQHENHRVAETAPLEA